MQFSWMKSTMPFEYCTMAPGEGQAFRQPGSAQCMQPSLRISHSRLSASGLVSFHSMQADWQALQPMHFETSISLATGVSCRSGGGRSLVAERRIRSAAVKLLTKPSEGGLLTAVVGPFPSAISDLRRPGGWLDIHQESLELRRIGVGVADEGC